MAAPKRLRFRIIPSSLTTFTTPPPVVTQVAHLDRRHVVVAKAKAKANANVAAGLLGADSSESEEDLLRGAVAAVQARSEQPTNAGVGNDLAASAAATGAQPRQRLESRSSPDVTTAAGAGNGGMDADQGSGYLEALEADLWEIIQSDGTLSEFQELADVVTMMEAASEEAAQTAAAMSSSEHERQQNEQRQEREAEEAAEQQEVDASSAEPAMASASAPAMAAADAETPSPAVPRADLRANALALLAEVVDPTVARHMLGVEKAPGSKLLAEPSNDQTPQRYIGKFYTIGGKTLPCVCAHGGSCKVMFNYKRSSQSAIAEAKWTLWLATGMYMSKDGHARTIPDFRTSVRALIAAQGDADA